MLVPHRMGKLYRGNVTWSAVRQAGGEGGRGNKPTNPLQRTHFVENFIQLEFESEEELKQNVVLRRFTKFPFLLAHNWNVLFEMSIVNR